MKTKVLNNKGICYFFVYRPQLIPGVHKKIFGTLSSAKKAGFEVRQYSNDPKDNPSFLKMLLNIVICNEKFLFVRSIFYLNFIIAPFILLARLQGKIVYCDVPTSFKSAFFETLDLKTNFIKKIVYLFGMFLGASWSLMPYHKIILYSDDWKIFSIGQKEKKLFIGNGIGVESFKKRKYAPSWPSNILRLVAVAFTSEYHGYDRIIKAISVWNNTPQYKIHFTIIGDGPGIFSLKKLVNQLRLNNYIEFKGSLDFDQTLPFYENSHIAVGSIGLHRKKMKIHSELKAREYTAVGIPFIASGIDCDFTSEEKFRLQISSDESITDIIQIFENIDNILGNINIDEISSYAHKKLTFDTKFEKYKIYV